MKKIQYYANQKINDLIFLKEIEPYVNLKGQKVRKALFQCYCGNEFEVNIASVKHRHTNSCGCWKVQRTGEAHRKHGLRSHPLNSVWNAMKQRCYRKNHYS